MNRLKVQKSEGRPGRKGSCVAISLQSIRQSIHESKPPIPTEEFIEPTSSRPLPPPPPPMPIQGHSSLTELRAQPSRLVKTGGSIEEEVEE